MPDFLEGIEQFLNSFSADELAVTRYAFQRILNGRPAHLETLTAALGMPTAVVEKAVAGLVKRGTMVLDPDTREIIGARGLSLTQTPHAVAINDRQLYAFCAVDAVGIPAALGADARVESRCHHCQAPLILELKGGAVITAPEGMVIWAVERDLSRSLRAHT